MVFSTVYYYLSSTYEIMIRTVNGGRISLVLFLIFGAISILFLFYFKRLRKLAIGFVFFFNVTVVSLFFNFNINLGNEGVYKRFKRIGLLTMVEEKRHIVSLEIDFERFKSDVGVNLCFEFDSLDLKIVDGYFGCKYYTNDLRVAQSLSCSSVQDIDSRCFSGIGIQLTKKRCFKEALEFYTKCIELNPKDNSFYLQRGKVNLFLNDYKKALSDFNQGILSLDPNDVIIFENTDVVELMDELRENYGSENNTTEANKKQSVLLDKLVVISNYSDYQEEIEFCLKKLQHKNFSSKN